MARMHLCLVDESGTPPKPNAKSPLPYFVIGGVIMHEAQWHGVATELTRLKRDPKFSINGEIKWRFFGLDNRDPRNAVAHLSADKRTEFRQRFFEILIKRKSIKVIACVTSVPAAYAQPYVNTAEDLYHFSYKLFLSGSNIFFKTLADTVGRRSWESSWPIIAAAKRTGACGYVIIN